MSKTDIQLWKNAFDVSIWKNEVKIKELLGVIESMDGIIEKYLGKTEKDFPFLTDHSINHSNILWEYADIIVGKSAMQLNPVEGFILNSVFLLHDAGMCYSVLNNKNEIQKEVIYQDYIANSKSEMSREQLEIEAVFYTVRQNHGEYAIRIAKDLLNGEEFFIADVNYRQEFCDFIGKIAKSHTCNINYIEREFGNLYSSPKFPKDWSIDFKKLSFLLRTADAANLDNLRTPRTLKAIAEIKGDSKEHWTFQKKLGFPKLELDGYLTYTTNSPFKKHEQKAWWYCYKALKVLDDELKNANNYFTSVGQSGFAAKSVKYVNDTISLGANSIKTEGWDSIDTTIRVSNPVHIASELGGEKLYGNKNIAIRELIQNSLDAIHVHRSFTGQNNVDVGKIKVSIEEDNGSYFLIVSDDGIGMTQNLMTNELLDFGGSYWKTNKFYNDYAGLVSKGFESIGKFGIGFFSVFMLGQKITITSWKYGENINTMRTLEFVDGLFTNPILRSPSINEKNSVINHGTIVRIKLVSNPYIEKGIVFEENFKDCSLKSLVQFYVPSADVEIIVKELDGKISVLKPNILDRLDFKEMLGYINLKDKQNIFKKILNYSVTLDSKEGYVNLPLQLIDVVDDYKLLGRLSLLPADEQPIFSRFTEHGVILSRGIRVTEIQGFIGYVNTNEVISLKRDASTKVIPYESMKIWAIAQIKQIEELGITELYEQTINDLKITFNLFDESFPLFKTKENGNYSYLSIYDFREFVKSNVRIVLYQEGEKISARNLNCDGFINNPVGFKVDHLIKDSDIKKINHSQKIIEDIFKNEWGEYDYVFESKIFSKDYQELPYYAIWTFTKK